MPLVEGPLAPKVVFPEREPSRSRVRDSNFIFGSVGNGHATLTINGASVPVAPNGTFLAYLPVPPPSAPRYDLVVSNGTDSARRQRSRSRPARAPRPRARRPPRRRFASASPRGHDLALRDDEPVRVTVRAPANASAWVLANNATLPLVNTGGNSFATDVSSAEMKNGAVLIVARDRDTVHLNLSRTSPDARRHRRRSSSRSAHDIAARHRLDHHRRDRCRTARTSGCSFPARSCRPTGRNNDNIRVRLDSELEVWVDSASVHSLPPGFPSPRRVVGAMAISPAPEWVDIVMPVSSPPPYLIEQTLDRINLTLYGTQATPDIIKFLQNDSLVRMVNWIPEQSDRRAHLVRAVAAAVRLSRAVRLARVRAAPATTAARVARASARGAHAHRRSGTSARRRDRADRVDRAPVGVLPWR